MIFCLLMIELDFCRACRHQKRKAGIKFQKPEAQAA